MIFTTKSLYLLSYLLIILVDTILDTFFNNTKFYHNYMEQFSAKYDFLIKFLILFFGIFSILTLFSLLFDTCLIIVNFDSNNLIYYISIISNNNENSTNILITEETIFESYLNNSYTTIIIQLLGLNNIIVAGYISGGGVLGHYIGRRIICRPLLKIISSLFVITGIEIVTAIMANILNNITVDEYSNSLNSNSYSKVNSYGFLLNSYTNTGINFLNDGFGDLLIKKYPEYPLSLLFELNRLINIEIIFMLMLINIFIIKKLNKIDFKKFIPNNKLGQIIEYIIFRYIQTWSSISKYMKYLAVGMIIYSIILSKLAMVLISIS